MQRIQGEFSQEPSARIEDFLSLNSTETQQLWSTNLQSIKDFRCERKPPGKLPFGLCNVTDKRGFAAADLERKREGKTHSALQTQKGPQEMLSLRSLGKG